MTYDYDSIERRLKSLSGLVASLAPSLAGWFDEYVDVGEYGLAVEIVAEGLQADIDDPRVRELAAGLLAEARLMGLSEATQDPLAALAHDDGTVSE
jgi:hypothetical protein